MRVFHGSTLAVEKPLAGFAKRHLDFGPGFYVTSYREQAERWARRKAMRSGGQAVVTEYELAGDLSGWRGLAFPVGREWLKFVCACRNGEEVWRGWDWVRGRVADDDVFKTVDAYLRGILDEERALAALRYAPENDQIAFLSQGAMDACLSFADAETLGAAP